MARRVLPACVLACTLIAASNAAAQPLTLTREDVASFGGARAIAAADFDRDGWIDLAQANTGRNTVTILINQRGSARGFVAADDIPVGLGPFDIAAADFNRDGFVDLAAANADANTVSILTGQSAGGFVRADIAAPSGPRGLTAVDVNRDGRADLIVTGWNSGTLQVLYGTGRGAFTTGPSISGLPAHPQGVAAADFNHDGRVDLAVVCESTTGLVLLTGTSAGFTPTAVTGASGLNVLTVADLNRDGWMDVAAASSGGNRVAVFVGSASGVRFNASYAVGGSPRGIAARDINSDGIADVITANRNGNSISVLAGSASAPGALLSTQTFAAGAGARTVVTGDFDRDGKMDVVTGNQDASSVTALWNDTAWEAAAFGFTRTSYGTPSSSMGASTVIPADFNEDGKMDVLLRPDYTVGRVLHVLLTDGPTVALESPQFYPGYIVDDLDNDGHADVLVVNSNPADGVMTPYLGNGRGAFTRAPAVTYARPISLVTSGELNGDGAVDLVVISFDRSISSYCVQVLAGTGNATFTPGARINTTYDYNAAPTIADVNRDGRNDLALFTGGTLTVLYGEGAGNLRPGSTTVFGRYVLQQLALADINMDGRLDAVAGEQGRLWVALGTASGFAAPTASSIEIPSNWANFAVADINVDGRPDIVSGAGFIMRGQGDGTFAAEERFAWDAQSAYIVDFNRDGLPDVVVPASNGAFDVIGNTRGTVNHAPLVDAGSDLSIEYGRQFWEEPPGLFAAASDPDLHWLTYQWRDERGNVVGWDSAYLPIEGLTHGTHTFTLTVSDGRGGVTTDSLRVTIVPTKEIVLWSASGFYNGTFSEVADSTAAGGERGYDKELGRAKVTSPSTNPVNRVVLGFIADPTQTYKLWIRLKADGNKWSNDSVWVQFTGSTDAQGNPVYRYGTSSGLEVNLEECSGCGVSGWGWEDDGWGAVNKNGVTLRFPSGGGQSIVIQTREDGVSIDQVVLSSEKYLTTRPGPAKNDTTILQFTYWQFEG